jgi:hypothetical protein
VALGLVDQKEGDRGEREAGRGDPEARGIARYGDGAEPVDGVAAAAAIGGEVAGGERVPADRAARNLGSVSIFLPLVGGFDRQPSAANTLRWLAAIRR